MGGSRAAPTQFIGAPLASSFARSAPSPLGCELLRATLRLAAIFCLHFYTEVVNGGSDIKVGVLGEEI